MWWTILQGRIYLQKMDDNNGKHCFDVLIGCSQKEKMCHTYKRFRRERCRKMDRSYDTK